MSLNIRKLLPQGNRLEVEVIEKIVELNKQIKDDLDPREKSLITSLRIASSETDALERWKNGLLFSQQYLDDEFLPNTIISKINFFLTGYDGYRKVQVKAADTKFPKPSEVYDLMEDFQKYLRDISNPVSRAAYIYQSLCSIHPFLDGNGRTARLVADHTLIANNFPPLIFPLPTLAFVIAPAHERCPHLMALNRILESTKWMKEILNHY